MSRAAYAKVMRYLSLILISSSLCAQNFDGVAISLSTLEKLKKGEQVQFSHPVDAKQLKQALFWYQELPIIGLRPQQTNTRYLPHQFTLWELAPNRGKGVRIAVIDSGVASFEIEGDPSYRKNVDLPETNQQSLNVAAPQLQQMATLINPNI